MGLSRFERLTPPSADHRLLARFADEQDATAFAELVRRHGPAVFGVCRRMLGHHQDAEDATQAVFVVLARNAAAIRRRTSVAAWLHGVAVRVCRKALGRRKKLAPLPAEPAAEPTWNDGLRAIDDALAALPESLRQPVVLCYLNGLTRDEAAAELGVGEATLRGRLDRGKERLRKELARRGIALSVGLVAAGLTVQPLSAATVVAVRDAAVGAAPLSASVQSLTTTGVLPMPTLKFWLAGSAAMALLLASGYVWIFLHPPPAAHADTFANLSKPDPKAGKVEAKLEGVWVANQSADGGKVTRDIRLQFVDAEHLVWELTHTSNTLPAPQVITLRLKYQISKEGELKCEVLERWNGVDKMAKLPENDQKPRVYSMTWEKDGNSFTLKVVPESESPWATMVFTRGGEPAKAAADPLVPETLTKIDRKIAKLPKFTSEKPGYCLLAFGEKAEFKVWVVLDGDNLHIDRNGNGGLTDDAPVKANAALSNPPRSYVFPATEIGAEKEQKWAVNLSTLSVGATQPAAILVATREGSTPQKVGPTDFRFADTPDTARVVHFGSKVLAVRPSLTMPSVLEEGQKVEFRVQVGTPGVGAGSFASVTNDGLNKKANPVAEFTFQPAKPGDKPVVVKAELKERCCGDQFFAAVEVPKETTGHKAAVTIRFPDYPHGSVAAFTGEVPVARK